MSERRNGRVKKNRKGGERENGERMERGRWWVREEEKGRMGREGGMEKRRRVIQEEQASNKGGGAVE